MNRDDSERLARQLVIAGHVPVSDADRASLVVLNGCSVREKSDRKVWGRIGALRAQRLGHPDRVEDGLPLARHGAGDEDGVRDALGNPLEDLRQRDPRQRVADEDHVGEAGVLDVLDHRGGEVRHAQRVEVPGSASTAS